MERRLGDLSHDREPAVGLEQARLHIAHDHADEFLGLCPRSRLGRALLHDRTAIAGERYAEPDHE